MLLAANAVPRKVLLKDTRFDLDLDAIDACIVLPDATLGSPKNLRISLTASDAMAERAVPAFAELQARR
jgi:hypothetical protein